MFARKLYGDGRVEIPASAEEVWDVLLDPAALARLIPGDPCVEITGPDAYRAVIGFSVGPCSGHYDASLVLLEAARPQRLVLSGGSSGTFGSGRADATVTLESCAPGMTAVCWHYESRISGPVSLLGGTLLGVATRLFVDRFFDRLKAWPFPG